MTWFSSSISQFTLRLSIHSNRTWHILASASRLLTLVVGFSGRAILDHLRRLGPSCAARVQLSLLNYANRQLLCIDDQWTRTSLRSCFFRSTLFHLVCYIGKCHWVSLLSGNDLAMTMSACCPIPASTRLTPWRAQRPGQAKRPGPGHHCSLTYFTLDGHRSIPAPGQHPASI